jgi:hypothetical protein
MESKALALGGPKKASMESKALALGIWSPKL